MPRITRLALLGGSVLLTAAAAVHATGQSPDIHPTTPYEYWHDYCDYPDVIPNAYEITGGSLQRLMSAEGMMVHSSEIVQRDDDPNFWRFKNTSPMQNYPGTTDPISGQVPFYMETRLTSSLSMRSGYIVAPNIFATAPHSTDFNPANFKVVFNLAAKKDPVTQQCVAPDPEHIPAADVFTPGSVIVNTLSTVGPFVDYMAFYLDREAVGHSFLRTRVTGTISPGDKLAVISHPWGLRGKLQYDLEYEGEVSNPSFPLLRSFPFLTGYYMLPGASGAPVYNLDRNYVEIMEANSGTGCLSFGSGAPTVHFMYDVCDDVADPPSADPPHFYSFNNGPISTLAEAVPTKYARASPLDDVSYVLPMGTGSAPSPTTYTIRASSSETANTSILVVSSPITMPVDQPGISIGSYASSLAPGASTTVTVTPTVPATSTCGRYDRNVAIIDQTHGVRDIMWHRFELGMTDFTISSAQALDLYAISAPSMPAQITFTLTNTRPTATTVAVSASPSWASLSSSSVSLAAAGQPGASATVSLSLATAAFSLAAGDYPITLSFADQSGCALTPTREQTVVFHKGKLVLTQSFSDVFVPMPTPPGSPTQSYIDIPESACISDMSVRLDTVNGSDAGDPLSVWSPHLGLSLDYAHGTTSYSLPLWANNALPTGWTVPTAYDPDLFADIETLLLDRHANTPPNGANWSLYVGKNAPAGRWTLKITDDGVGSVGRNGAIVPQWTLELVGTPATCRVSL